MTTALRVEKGGLLEQQRDGLLVKVPLFVIDDAPRPDLAQLMNGRGAIGTAESPWTSEVRNGERCAVLHVVSTAVGGRPFSVAFPLRLWAEELLATVNANELGLVLSSVAHLPAPYNGLALWVRGRQKMRQELRALLEAEQ